MSGGYIVCGDFSGDDKSGSAFFGVLEALPECVAVDQSENFANQVLTPLAEYFEENEDHYLIDSELAALLLEPVETLYLQYGEELRHPELFEAPQIDQKQGLNSTDAKWGKGIGWRYYCLHDLQQALQQSIKSGDPVLIHFD